jgi:large repetitive protein
MIWLTALLFHTAVAQDTIDAHGFSMAPNDGDLQDPVVAFRPETQTPMSFGIVGLFEYADSPLVLVEQSGDTVTRTPALDNLFVFNLGVHGAFHERIGVGVTMPLYLTSASISGTDGPTIGDLRLSVPVGLVLPDPDDGGFGLSLVPFVDMPTGDPDRFLGNAGFSGGGLLAIGYATGPLAITTNIGMDVQASANYLNLRGGGHLLLNVAGAYKIGDYHAVGTEAWFRPRIGKNEFVGAESPGEVLFFGRGRYEMGLSWTLGGGFGITSGAGASNFRLLAGVGWAFGKEMGRDTDGDGFLDKVDACIDQPETVNDYADSDGCPDMLASAVITVLDEDANPLSEAYVTIKETEYRTDAAGKVSVTGLMPGSTVIATAEHPWCTSAPEDAVKIRHLEEGENSAEIRLPLKPARVKVITKANTGQVLDATVRAHGPTIIPDINVGDDGEEVIELRPGDWEVLVTAPDFGVESRKLSLAPGETSLIVIEVILQPAKVKVEKERVVILEKVFFDYDKDTIMERSLSLLREVANTLRVNEELTVIEIGGHTDSRGSASYNKELSQRRVESVRKFLIQNGVGGSRLVAKGYGESKPISRGNSEKAHAANRRVEFNILKQTNQAPEVQQGTGGAQ